MFSLSSNKKVLTFLVIAADLSAFWLEDSYGQCIAHFDQEATVEGTVPVIDGYIEQYQPTWVKPTLWNVQHNRKTFPIQR